MKIVELTKRNLKDISNILRNKEQEEIDLIARKNLDLINKLSEV